VVVRCLKHWSGEFCRVGAIVEEHDRIRAAGDDDAAGAGDVQ
jgi:hypothetical protein